MTVFSPMASIHWGEDGHGQVSFCVCSISTFSFSTFALHIGISRTLNSQSSQVSDRSNGSSKIRVFLRLWFSTLSILDSSFSTRACRCWRPRWRSWQFSSTSMKSVSWLSYSFDNWASSFSCTFCIFAVRAIPDHSSLFCILSIQLERARLHSLKNLLHCRRLLRCTLLRILLLFPDAHVEYTLASPLREFGPGFSSKPQIMRSAGKVVSQFVGEVLNSRATKIPTPRFLQSQIRHILCEGS